MGGRHRGTGSGHHVRAHCCEVDLVSELVRGRVERTGGVVPRTVEAPVHASRTRRRIGRKRAKETSVEAATASSEPEVSGPRTACSATIPPKNSTAIAAELTP